MSLTIKKDFQMPGKNISPMTPLLSRKLPALSMTAFGY